MAACGNRTPKGEMKVVNSADSWDRGTCQKPELASSFEKIVAPDSWARTWSIEGSG